MKSKFNYLLAFVMAFTMATFAGAVFAGKDNQGSKKNEAKEGKTLVCHVSKKSIDDCFPIEVSGVALAAHLAHGDRLEECGVGEILVDGVCLPVLTE